MFMKTTNIRKIFRAAVAAVAAAMAMSSCTDHFDLGKIEGEPKIVMYCMPSCSDTTSYRWPKAYP